MKSAKYILTKYETIRRTEKVKYVVVIPNNIKDKESYAQKQLESGNYVSCKVVDIVDSEMLDENFVGLIEINKSQIIGLIEINKSQIRRNKK